jgi:hypothetical protein
VRAVSRKAVFKVFIARHLPHLKPLPIYCVTLPDQGRAIDKRRRRYLKFS